MVVIWRITGNLTYGKSRESNKDHYNDVALDTGFCNNLYSGIQRDKTKWKCVCELYHIDRLRRLS